MLRTKCIKAKPETSDGIRISVMSRHTLNDGITPDPEITADMYDEWRQELAPPAKLVGQHYRGEISWEAFEDKYKSFLKQKSDSLRQLIALCQENTVTLLCIEPTPEKCHRRLIAEACKKIDPALEVDIH